MWCTNKFVFIVITPAGDKVQPSASIDKLYDSTGWTQAIPQANLWGQFRKPRFYDRLHKRISGRSAPNRQPSGRLVL